MKCMGKDCSAEASTALRYSDEFVVTACFPCADKMMLMLAAENVGGGASIEETADAYARWRGLVGAPCTIDVAMNAVDASVRKEMS